MSPANNGYLIALAGLAGAGFGKRAPDFRRRCPAAQYLVDDGFVGFDEKRQCNQRQQQGQPDDGRRVVGQRGENLRAGLRKQDVNDEAESYRCRQNGDDKRLRW